MPHGNRQKHLSKNLILQSLLRKFNHDVANIASSCHPKQILDVGCGEGFTTYEIAKVLPNANITAIDIDDSKLEFARQYKKSQDITYMKGDIYDLSMFSKHADLIICTEVLEHLNNYTSALANLALASKKYIMISVPNEPWFRMANALRFKYISRFGNSPQHVNNWTKKGFLYLLSSHFKIIQYKTSSFWNIALVQQIPRIKTK